jgi:hypothetical protein
MKNNHLFWLSVLAIIFFNCHSPVKINNKNAYLFIEPYYSVDYDSNIFRAKFMYQTFPSEDNKVGIFFLKKDTTRFSRIILFPDSRDLKDTRFIRIIDTLDKNIRHMQGFYVNGSIKYDSTWNKQVARIAGIKIFETGGCLITFDDYETGNLEQSFKILDDFLAGWKSYSKAEIAKEDSIVRSQYTVMEDSVSASQIEIEQYNATHAFIVRAKGPDPDKVTGAQFGFSFYYANKNGEVRIPVSKKIPVSKNIRVLRSGRAELYVRNSFGKNVRLPLSHRPAP